jgi:hypothetical protein
MNQMQKTLVTLGGLLLVAAGVGLFAYKGVVQEDERAAKKKAMAERLFANDDTERKPDAGEAKIDFRKVTVTAKGETTVLEKASPDAQWRITSPIDSKVDALVLDGVLSQLQSARFKTTLEGDATDAELKTYGLDVPSFSVEADAEINGRPHHVRLEGGIENPFDGTIYMRRDGSRTVHMAEGGVRWSIAKTTFDLRDKELFAIDEPKIKRIAVKSAYNDWELVRGEDKVWKLTRPEQGLADTTTVNAVIGGFRGERVNDFPGEPTPDRLKALGFDKPAITATYGLDDGDVTFTLAAPSADAGDVLYALREDREGKRLGRVNASARNAIDRNVVELRDRSLIPFSKQAVTKIVVTAPGAPELVVERDPGATSVESWKVTSPKSGPAKAYKVATALWTLAATKQGTTVVDAPDPKVLETYGLDAKSAKSIRLFDGKGATLATLLLGKALVGKQGSSYALGARKAIVEIDSSRFNELPWTADDLLDVPAADSGVR